VICSGNMCCIIYSYFNCSISAFLSAHISASVTPFDSKIGAILFLKVF
jgi:hypothetical protein